MLVTKGRLGNIRSQTFKQHVKLPPPHKYRLMTGKLPQVDIFLRQRLTGSTFRPLDLQGQTDQPKSRFRCSGEGKNASSYRQSHLQSLCGQQYSYSRQLSSIQPAYALNKIIIQVGVWRDYNRTRLKASKLIQELYSFVKNPTEKLTVTQMAKTLPTGTPRFTTVFTKSRHWALSRASRRSPQL